MANETTTAPVEHTAPANENVQGATASGTNVPAPATKEAPATTPGAEGGEHHATYNPKMPEPQIINGVKVYPTSYIPARAELHYPKKMLIEMQEWHIEAVHILVFFIILFALFIGPWKRPNHR
jgi:hypothetical protein